MENMKGRMIRPPKPCTESEGCRGCSYGCIYKPKAVPTYEEALRKWFSELPEPATASESLPLSMALGRVTAKPSYAALDVPSATCATHDGIAIRFEECRKRTETGKVLLAPGEFLHCPMGSYIPDEFDTIAHAEQCNIFPDGSAELLSLPLQYQSVQLKGSSLYRGELLIDINERLTPSHLALMQYAGLKEALVFRKPRIGIIPIGDDLLPAGSRPGEGQCIDCDSLYIRAMAEQYGALPLVSEIVADETGQIEDAAAAMLEKCDAMILIGGVSKGEKNYGDYTADVLRKHGRISCYGVRLSPGGKHLMLGQMQGKPVIGMPGPPHAMLVLTQFFVPALIQRFLSCPVYEMPVVRAELEHDLPPRGGGEDIWECRVILTEKADGAYTARMAKLGETTDNFINASGTISVTGSREQFRSGCTVAVKLLKNPSEIKRRKNAI